MTSTCILFYTMHIYFHRQKDRQRDKQTAKYHSLNHHPFSQSKSICLAQHINIAQQIQVTSQTAMTLTRCKWYPAAMVLLQINLPERNRLLYTIELNFGRSQQSRTPFLWLTTRRSQTCSKQTRQMKI